MDSQDNKRKWKNRELIASLEFALKNAKDMAAGAVLVISGFALVTGLIIFVPKLWALVFG